MKLEMIQVNNNLYLGDFIRILRNSTEYRDCFINNTYITSDIQKEYMSIHGKNYYVCVRNKKNSIEPLGFIGIVDNDIRLAIRLEYKRQGIGTFMLNFIKNLYPNFKVKVKKSNIPSQKFFDKHNIKYTIAE